MPRMARRRDPEVPHHIMCRSISEIKLFRNDDDKEKYIQLMASYCKKFQCSILSYCLMDNHVHIQFDPQGCDISKFMHGLNLSYAIYYNRKYNRRGPVFQGRFISKPIDSDEYNLIVSAYIHNNPKNLPDYREAVHTYHFSSYGVYLGYRKDDYGIINRSFILSQFGQDFNNAIKLYAEFVEVCNEIPQKQMQLELIEHYTKKEPLEYRSERYIYPRERKPEQIIDYVSEFLDYKPKELLRVKYKRKIVNFRAICIFLMRCLCDYTYKEICKEIGNLTVSQVANLCNKGFKLITDNPKYKFILPKLVDTIKIA